MGWTVGVNTDSSAYGFGKVAGVIGAAYLGGALTTASILAGPMSAPSLASAAIAGQNISSAFAQDNNYATAHNVLQATAIFYIGTTPQSAVVAGVMDGFYSLTSNLYNE